MTKDSGTKHSGGIFTQTDLDHILSTVSETEHGTSGEIVPYVVAASDSYLETVWGAAAWSMAAVLTGLAAASLLADTWMTLGIAAVAIIALAAGIIAALLFLLVPRLRVLCAGREKVIRRVSARAAQAFLSEEVFRTRDRSGILIFLSLLEHRVVVLGDSGINAKVAQEEWQGIVDRIIAGVRAGKAAEGMADAIRMCGTILRDRGFVIAPDDLNELPDRLRLG